jgi:hypothetical protein
MQWMRAAMVTKKRMIGQSRTWLEIDLGADALITKEWYAALLDPRGRPIGGWVHPDSVNRRDAVVIVPVKYDEIPRESARIALVKELPE